jgi:hypothetical protein
MRHTRRSFATSSPNGLLLRSHFPSPHWMPPPTPQSGIAASSQLNRSYPSEPLEAERGADATLVQLQGCPLGHDKTPYQCLGVPSQKDGGTGVTVQQQPVSNNP